MNIEVKPELVARLNQSLDLGKFKTIEELVEYLLTQYIYFYEHDDNLIEVIDSFKDTIHEIKNPVTDDFDIQYEVDDLSDYE